MPSTEQKRKERERKRNGFLDVAQRLFSKDGVDRVTMDQIATAAGVAKGTIYLYFKNKDDIVFAIVDRRLQLVFRGFGEALADASDGFDLAARMLKCEQSVMFSEDYDLRSLFVEKMTNVQSLSQSPGLEAHVKLVSRIKRAWFHAVERGQQDGSIRADIPPQSLVAHVWGGLLGSFIIRRNAERRIQMGPDLVTGGFVNDDETVQLLLDALRPVVAASVADRRVDGPSEGGDS